MPVETASAVMPPVDTLITCEAREAIRSAITDNDGGEVFFIGHVNAQGQVDDVEPYAFGNKRAVPALSRLTRPGDVVIHNHPGGPLEPSDADISVASHMGDEAIGFYIIDNACESVRVVVKAFREETLHLLEPRDIGKFFVPDGVLAKSLKDFDYRPQQVEMAREAALAFNDSGIAVIEAGTGVGKSMAYLVPAILWAVRNRERVVVSTNTINLQEQLIEKDLPFLRQRLGVEFSAGILMGRNNYLCQRKTEYARGERLAQESPSVREHVQAIFAWAEKTRNGCRSELPHVPSLDAWELVMSEGDNCLRIKCPFYTKCFFYNARRRAARADILVVNHHLLMADLALRRETSNYSASAVLPPFARVVMDEAHNTEEVATDYFGFRVSRLGFVRALGRLSSSRGRGKGVLSHLARKVEDAAQGLDGELLDRAREKFYIQLPQLRDNLELMAREQFEEVAESLLRLEGRTELKPREEIKRRVTEAVAQSAFWRETVALAVARMVAGVVRFCECADEAIALLEDFPKDAREALASPVMELRSLSNRLQGHASTLNLFHQEDDRLCRWFEMRMAATGALNLTFCGAPLEVAESMQSAIYGPCKTVIMTSATLTVDQRFDYFLAQAGLAERAPSPAGQAIAQRLRTAALSTPFDFEKQAYVGVPVDVPEPNQPDFPVALEALVRQALGISEGHAFVLFTNYRLLARMHQQLAPELAARHWLVLRQGEANRHRLLEMFRAGSHPTLFATSSFWEGVDVKGSALQLLLLTRLPFQVPSEPILEARIEMIEQRGGDPFMELTVPSAIIRFRQGFGRLIRSREDRGAVLILDARVATRRYGRKFLNSLPTQSIHVESTQEVMRAMAEFFGQPV